MRRLLGSRRRRGFVLITTAVSVIAILGMLGLMMDLGSAYVAKSESQAYTDAAALAAAFELNGTLAGITAAEARVAASTNKWYFATKSLTGTVTEFSTDKVTWVDSPTTGAGYKFARVTARNNLGVFFTSVVNSQTNMSVAAQSIAGNQPPTSYPQGVFPFAPFAHDPTGPDFGYTKGDELTLLWPSSVQSNGNDQQLNNLCQSDRNQSALDAVRSGLTAERGYIMESSASDIAEAIEDDQMDYTVSLGMPVYRTGGVKTTDVYASLNDRVNQDSSPNGDDIDTYLANHSSSPTRRMVIVPIINNATDAIVLGFVKVLLPQNQPHNPNRSKCAIYYGPADLPSGNGASGTNTVRLIQ